MRSCHLARFHSSICHFLSPDSLTSHFLKTLAIVASVASCKPPTILQPPDLHHRDHRIAEHYPHPSSWHGATILAMRDAMLAVIPLPPPIVRCFSYGKSLSCGWPFEPSPDQHYCHLCQWLHLFRPPPMDFVTTFCPVNDKILLHPMTITFPSYCSANRHQR